jgi:hypothetical protein
VKLHVPEHNYHYPLQNVVDLVIEIEFVSDGIFDLLWAEFDPEC